MSDNDLLIQPRSHWYERIRWQTWISVVSLVVSLSSALFTWQLVRVGDRQANAANSAATTADNTLKEVQKANRVDQRPWVSGTAFALSGEPTRGTPITIKVFLKNTGKTPARNQFMASQLLLQTGDPIEYGRGQPACPNGRSIVPPGDAGISDSTVPATVPDLALMVYNAGVIRLYVRGVIWYMDSTDLYHWTTICAYHIHGERLDYFHFCNDGNDMDR